jgi:hypothetical protein
MVAVRCSGPSRKKSGEPAGRPRSGGSRDRLAAFWVLPPLASSLTCTVLQKPRLPNQRNVDRRTSRKPILLPVPPRPSSGLTPTSSFRSPARPVRALLPLLSRQLPDFLLLSCRMGSRQASLDRDHHRRSAKGERGTHQDPLHCSLPHRTYSTLSLVFQRKLMSSITLGHLHCTFRALTMLERISRLYALVSLAFDSFPATIPRARSRVCWVTREEVLLSRSERVLPMSRSEITSCPYVSRPAAGASRWKLNSC